MDSSPKEFTLKNGITVMAKQLSRTQFNRLLSAVGIEPEMAREQRATEYTVRMSLAGQKVSAVKNPMIEKHPILGNLLASSEFDKINVIAINEIAVFAFEHLSSDGQETSDAGNSEPPPNG